MLGKQQLEVGGVQLERLQLVEDSVQEVEQGVAIIEGVVVGRCVHRHWLACIGCIPGDGSGHH